MPIIDSMSHLRTLSQTQGSFIRLNRNNAQLTTSTTKAHFWQRSLRKAEKDESRAAAERVRDSVCAHCGKAAGTILFNRYIGEKSLQGARFTGSSLAKLLDAASRHNVAYISDKLRDFAGSRALLPEIQQELNRFGANEDDFMSLMQQTIGILEGDFFSDEEVAQASARLITVQQNLVQLQNSLSAFQNRLQHGAPGVPHLQSCVTGLIGELRGKADMLIAQEEQNPFSGKNVRTAFKQIYAAYEIVINREITRLNQELTGASPQQAALLNRQTNDLNDLLQRVQSDRVSPPAMQNVPDGTRRVSQSVLDAFRKLPQTLGKELHNILPTLSPGRLAKDIKAAHVQVLNSQPWNVIQRDVQYLGQAGVSVTARSTITPARHIGIIGQTMARDNLQGVSCGDRGQERHAVNLASTEISVGGTTLFRGLRHGVNSAYTLTNPVDRMQANNTRALEIFTAAVQSSPELLQKAQAAQPGDIIDLPLLSTSLLTPDVWRRFGGGAEKNHLREQCNAWQEACQGGLCQISVSIAGQTKTVTVRPDVITFNFGVNTGAQSTGKTLFGGWGTSMQYNEQAMAKLFGTKPDWQGGVVAQYLNQPGVSNRNKQIVADLRSQIIDLWENEGFKETGEDPYRLPARLAMLGHIMGMMPLFNCKSGKDRTGQMDVACKTLALQIYERNGRIPPLNHPRTSMDKQIFQQVAINGGNLEMQRMNTGLAGFKTSGVKGLDRLFSESAKEMHRGLSHYVEV